MAMCGSSTRESEFPLVALLVVGVWSVVIRSRSKPWHT